MHMGRRHAWPTHRALRARAACTACHLTGAVAPGAPPALLLGAAASTAAASLCASALAVNSEILSCSCRRRGERAVVVCRWAAGGTRRRRPRPHDRVRGGPPATPADGCAQPRLTSDRAFSAASSCACVYAFCDSVKLQRSRGRGAAHGRGSGGGSQWRRLRTRLCNCVRRRVCARAAARRLRATRARAARHAPRSDAPVVGQVLLGHVADAPALLLRQPAARETVHARLERLGGEVQVRRHDLVRRHAPRHALVERKVARVHVVVRRHGPRERAAGTTSSCAPHRGPRRRVRAAPTTVCEPRKNGHEVTKSSESSTLSSSP